MLLPIDYLEMGNLGSVQCRKKTVNILTMEKTMEEGKDHSGDQHTAWRQVLGDNQRPGLLTPVTVSGGRVSPDSFLSALPRYQRGGS